MRKNINTIIISIIFALTPVMLMAAASEPETALKNGVDDMLAVINDPQFAGEGHKKRRTELLFSKAESLFDFNEFSRGALGKNWERFSDSQRSEFSKYFSKLIAKSYLAKIDNEEFKDVKIEYLKTEKLAPTKSGIERVQISADISHNKIVTPVNYAMMKKHGDGWKIYDVKIEGVSLVANYREQYRTKFNDLPEKIIQEIKEKIEQ